MEKRLIFQIGTNNWQRGEEFAPGSGILHEAHHKAYNDMEHTVGYSIYPSRTQTSDDDRVAIFSLDHDIPICESISPVSNYRFHSMSDAEFDGYCNKLMRCVEAEIARAEEAEGVPVSVAIAHHSFLNPLILSRINARRAAPMQLLCFVHGTALKMFAHEKAGIDPEYPRRFLPMMEKAGIFGPNSPIDACAAISNEQLTKFSDVFPQYPKERMLLSPNGFDTGVFHQIDGLDRNVVLSGLDVAQSPIASAPEKVGCAPDKVVVFCGKFADWKRLDALLHAAASYETRYNVATLIIGSGPKEAIHQYHSMAYEKLGLKQTYFLGPRGHSDIAMLNNIADVGVYPSRNEPFGLVFIECMACGTPVIGANSGGPKDFVTDAVGGLIPEAEGDELTAALTSAIGRALEGNWKHTKGPVAARYARENFSVMSQCEGLMAPFEAKREAA